MNEKPQTTKVLAVQIAFLEREIMRLGIDLKRLREQLPKSETSNKEGK